MKHLPHCEGSKDIHDPIEITMKHCIIQDCGTGSSICTWLFRPDQPLVPVEDCTVLFNTWLPPAKGSLDDLLAFHAQLLFTASLPVSLTV